MPSSDLTFQALSAANQRQHEEYRPFDVVVNELAELKGRDENIAACRGCMGKLRRLIPRKPGPYADAAVDRQLESALRHLGLGTVHDKELRAELIAASKRALPTAEIVSPTEAERVPPDEAPRPDGFINRRGAGEEAAARWPARVEPDDAPAPDGFLNPRVACEIVESVAAGRAGGKAEV